MGLRSAASVASWAGGARRVLAALVAGAVVSSAGASPLAPDTAAAVDATLCPDPSHTGESACEGGCLHGVLDVLLRESDVIAAREGEDPAVRRERLLSNLRNSSACFVRNPTPEQLRRIAEKFGGRNPSEKATRFSNRFILGQSSWDGNGQGISVIPGRASRIDRLTYSFPADGTIWTRMTDLPPPDDFEDFPNDLNAQLDARFGLIARDYGRELFRQVFAAWKFNCGVDYAEVCDDGSRIGLNFEAPGAPRGDIRIGACPQGTQNGVLAFNFFPEFGGDMVLNSSYFTPFDYWAGGGTGTYRYFRNAVAHEHGHGLGFRHVIPCTETKLMEPFSSLAYETIQRDEKRGAQFNYGDRYAGNHAPNTARELNLQHVILPATMTEPARLPSDPRYGSTGTNFKQAFALDHNDPAAGFVPHSAIERDLSTNGRINGLPTDPPATDTAYDSPTAIVNANGQDWFAFSLEHAYPVVITVDPTGGTYTNGPQVSSGTNPCTGTSQVVNADTAGNLNVELYSEDPVTRVLTRIRPDLGTGAGPGLNEVIDAGLLLPGRYLIRVYDIGPNPNGFDAMGMPVPGLQPMPTQLYDLMVRLGPSNNLAQQLKYPPLAIAGVDKIVPVSTMAGPILASFLGNVNSRTQEPGATPLTSSIDYWEWDLDGDGVFELNRDDFLNPPMGQQPIDPRAPYATTPTDNRLIPVTLRVTDSNGLKAQDTIYVKVTGAPIVLTGPVPPAFGTQGTVVLMSITGTGLGAVTDPSQVTFSGLGVRCVGAPRANPTGTQLDVSVQVDLTAAIGLRSVTVSDGCATNSLADAFEVRPLVPPPPRDECTGADTMAWSGDFGVKPFDSAGATTGSPQTYPMTPCAGRTIEGDVWYTWTVPPCTSPTITVVPMPPSGMFLRIAVYSVDPGMGPPCDRLRLLACGAQAVPPGPADPPIVVPVTPGQLLYFRVGSAVPGQTGAGSVEIRSTVPIGACCTAASACSCTTQTDCINSGGTSWIAGLTCGLSPNDNPCPGHCCLPTGGCVVNRTQAACAALDPQAVWVAGNLTCSPNNCSQPGACCDGLNCEVVLESTCNSSGRRFLGNNTTCGAINNCGGACCRPTGACEFLPPAVCALTQGVYQGDGIVCLPSTCPQPGACCDGPNCLAMVLSNACVGGTFRFLGAGTACTGSPCVGACCRDDGSCQLTTPADCTAAMGNFSGDGTVCTPNTCPQPGACCAGATCSLSLQSACAATSRFLGAGSACTANNPCIGACCRGNGNCELITPSDCANLVSGVYSGDGTLCLPNPCPQPGACCAGTNCTVVLATSCPFGSRFLGQSTVCGTNTCTPGACCDAGDCTLVLATDCAGPGVRFLGVGSVCGTGASCTVGVCCSGGNCTSTISADCPVVAADAAFIAGGTCGPGLCAVGACCNDAACTSRVDARCTSGGGRFLGAGQACAPNPCTGACCSDTTGACSTTTAAACTGVGVAYRGDGTTCSPNPCPQPGACCDPAPSTRCEVQLSTTCAAVAGATFLGAGTTCSAMPCTPGACCTGSRCDLLRADECAASSNFGGPGTACTPINPCFGACCITATGVCENVPQSACTAPGQTWTPGVTCNPTVCRFVGACCNGTSCAVGFETDCASGGGIFQGQASACGPMSNPTTCCPANINGIDGVTIQDVFDYLAYWFALDARAEFDGVPGIGLQDLFNFLAAWVSGCGQPGACCNQAACTVVTQSACVGMSGQFRGPGVACENGPGNPVACCRANVNGAGGVDVADIFLFLQYYFSGDPRADFDGLNGVELTDLFLFLSEYFAGCS